MTIIDMALPPFGALCLRRLIRLPRDPFINYWKSRSFQTHNLSVGPFVLTWRLGSYAPGKK